MSEGCVAVFVGDDLTACTVGGPHARHVATVKAMTQQGDFTELRLTWEDAKPQNEHQTPSQA